MLKGMFLLFRQGLGSHPRSYILSDTSVLEKRVSIIPGMECCPSPVITKAKSSHLEIDGT
ncbi:hypothetical protein J6590_030715 [Homalodisca vitripennis]|nr:hypothetical protein J6590_030715 [Homalodisca vitripennis]